MGWLRLAGLGIAAAAAALPLAAAADASPYPAGAAGADVAVWQCDSIPAADFIVVAINNGRPFSVNPCLGRQAASLGRQPGSTATGGAYLNTGYDDAYLDRVSGGCAERAATAGLAGAAAGAYGVGCSEAERSWQAAMAAGLAPTIWWLDVEVANSWADRPELNRQALQGLTDYLVAVGGTVGVYSTPRQWRQVVGGAWTPSGAVADWLAGAVGPEDALRRCSRTVTGNPTWLVQYVSGGADVDLACAAGQ